jgi:hypothetical protein
MRKNWTERETKYLESYYESRSVEYIAKKLGRSIPSVKHKAQQIGLNSYASDSIRLKTLANCFCVDSRVVHRWMEKYGLKMKTESHGKRTMYSIYVKDFWEWAEKNRQVIQWSKYQVGSLIPEPDWVSDEVRAYKKVKHRSRITESDIFTIEKLLKNGKNYRQIAEEIGRTYNSVKHIAYNYNI